MDQPSSNGLLDALRPADLEGLLPRLKTVNLGRGASLYEPSDMIDYCYFPGTGAIAAYYVVLEDGDAVEAAMVGCEGALGGIVSQGRLPAYARASVMRGGSFYKIPIADLAAAKAENRAVEWLFNRYADCFVAQVFQSVACNAAHTVDQRAARWLVAAFERTGSSSVAMTQEALGGWLGAGRSYVSRVLQRFRERGLVAPRRGAIEIVDEAGLRAAACDCNDHIRAHFDEVLRGVYPD